MEETKNLEQEIQDLKEENLKLMTKVRQLEVKGLELYQQNEMVKASPEIAIMKAKMDYELSMAEQFIRSGAFKVANAHQAYTIIKAGQEMGLAPVQSMNALYIVNGSINPYGKHMVGQLTAAGYRIKYEDETPNRVKVRVYHPDLDFDESELVTDQDQILQKSNAMKFGKKNKMRFHGIRMIINFHLAHLFGSVSDMMVEDLTEQGAISNGRPDVAQLNDSKESRRIMEHIKNSKHVDELEMVEDHLETNLQRELYLEKLNELSNQELSQVPQNEEE